MKLLLTTFTALVLFLTNPLIAAESPDSPETVAGAVTVDATQAKKLFDEEVAFIDVRKDKDWTAGRVPGAIHLELKKVFTEESLGEVVNKDDAVVIYCNGSKCLRSSQASAKAVAWGFTRVHYFRDGLPAWTAAKYPVE